MVQEIKMKKKTSVILSFCFLLTAIILLVVYMVSASVDEDMTSSKDITTEHSVATDNYGVTPGSMHEEGEVNSTVSTEGKIRLITNDSLTIYTSDNDTQQFTIDKETAFRENICREVKDEERGSTLDFLGDSICTDIDIEQEELQSDSDKNITVLHILDSNIAIAVIIN